MQIGYFELIISCIFVNNILLAQFLGNCPFLGTSKKMETAVGMAMAVVFVLVLAAVISWATWTYLLIPLHLEYLRTIAFILVIAAQQVQDAMRALEAGQVFGKIVLEV